jgi:hypothetical protein
VRAIGAPLIFLKGAAAPHARRRAALPPFFSAIGVRRA